MVASTAPIGRVATPRDIAEVILWLASPEVGYTNAATNCRRLVTMAPTHQDYDAFVCGAGIAGIAAAYALTQTELKRVIIVDPGPPLSLTSDKSTECYRNWWPGPGDAMVSLMNRSIDLMEGHAQDSGNSSFSIAGDSLRQLGRLWSIRSPNKRLKSKV